ncbi:sugar ABC transporter permease [Streptomyces sp. NRRL_ISP-5395]|uniref:carbohydrate ABC transporter permease n=1 Tax=Streptomyces TaxID=1883 RepID=UPI0018746178|nr:MULTISPECIES: sugar ABC transporter permease [Streptomyces]MDX2671798.1 sugar ABC transporter permease [Streptomyces sp. NRRL_ISP-5395]GHF52272.1 ABC transporter permease [Streptomyces griseus]
MTVAHKPRTGGLAAGRRSPLPPESAHGRPRAGRRRTITTLTPWLFLAAPLTLLLMFTFLPVADMIGYSFTDWDGISPTRSFVGGENYTDLVTRPARFEVFLVSGFYLVASFLQIALALYFATVLSFNTRFRNLFKGLLFFPYLINGVAVGFVFLYFFQPDGTLDTLLRLVGAEGEHLWLGNPDLANPSLAGVSVWRFMGLNMVLFLGAIQSIPPHLYEAAELDGANRWQQFRHIIAPSIKPIISLSFILAVSGSLAVFEIPYIMTGGANGTETFVIQTVKLAFQFDKVGLASASAVVLLLLILLVTWVQRRLFPEERVELS